MPKSDHKESNSDKVYAFQHLGLFFFIFEGLVQIFYLSETPIHTIPVEVFG